jgi:NADH-quinone oxidoreductase subunit A
LRTFSYLFDGSSMDPQYIPVLASLCVAAIIPGVFLVANLLLSPRRPSTIKSEAFECGNAPSGPAWGRFAVKFYLPAILFIVFDVEVVFMYPWAVLYRRLGIFGFVEMTVFMAVLVLGLAYVWRKGALEWD